MRIVALALLALAVLVVPAHAVTMYEYTGNPFTSWTGDSCLGDCRLTAVFTVETPLAANIARPAIGVSVYGGVQFVSDGFTTLSQMRGEAYIYSTDAYGLPLEWDVWQEFEPEISYELGTFRCLTGERCPRAADFVRIIDRQETGVGSPYSASNEGAPGTWRIVTVPEPASLLLVGLGILVAGPMIRLRRSARRRPAGARAG